MVWWGGELLMGCVGGGIFFGRNFFWNGWVVFCGDCVFFSFFSYTLETLNIFRNLLRKSWWKGKQLVWENWIFWVVSFYQPTTKIRKSQTVGKKLESKNTTTNQQKKANNNKISVAILPFFVLYPIDFFFYKIEHLLYTVILTFSFGL